MKKIINGKKYDTNTACFIKSVRCYHGPGNFRNYEEDLYLKKTGEFFLCGSGGPLSRYREEEPFGGWTDGEGIIPLSKEEAREWMEINGDVDEYEGLFGEADE